MFRAATRPIGIFATLSLLLLTGLPAAFASSNLTSPCGWDTAGGWVARENTKAGDPECNR